MKSELERLLVDLDGNFRPVDEDYVVDSRRDFNVGDYLESRSHLAALSLSKNHGLSIGIYVDRRPESPADTFNPLLLRAFCTLPDLGLFVDVQGLHQAEEFRNEFRGQAHDFQEAYGDEALNFLEAQMLNGILAEFRYGERKELAIFFEGMVESGLLSSSNLDKAASTSIYDDEVEFEE